MERAVPDDEVLLAAAGWQGVPSARVLARAVTGGFCVAVVDSNGALGAQPYETVEFFVRSQDGTWQSDGEIGPAGGTGWHAGFAYVCDTSAANEVTVIFEGERHPVPTGTNGWFAFAAPQDDHRSLPHVHDP